jgi:NAD(P)-dependent dehydrogenase (short-subunit alcohol dehydrogenase family)
MKFPAYFVLAVLSIAVVPCSHAQWTPLQPSGGQLPEKLPDFGVKVPLGRPGQPADLAPIYVLLASQESSYVTGETYGVTGGNALP